MYSKQFVYLLFGIIALLFVMFVFSMSINYKKNVQLDDAISKFNSKLKTDSIFFIDSNKQLLNKITHHIIDSLSNIYDKKLALASNTSKKRVSLYTNNNNITAKTKPNNTSNLTLIIENTSTQISENPSVITYSQLENYQVEKINDNNSYSNVTTYSKIKNNIKVNSEKKDQFTSTIVNKPLNNNSITNHNNPLLDNALNINDLDKVPVYKGCEHQLTEFSKKKCFKTKIYNYIINGFNSKIIQNSGFKTESNKIRVLFIINKKGYAKTSKIIGKWSEIIQKNVKQVIKSIPKMTPGYRNNKPTNVKYSILVPYNI